MSTFTRARLAEIMEIEGKKKLVWKPGSEATKFTKKFEPSFGKGRFSWCAATVTWACEQAGLPMPVKAPSTFGYTFALVEAWQQWAMSKGFYLDNDGKFQPEAGDITIFDWNQININEPDRNWESHIGVHLRMSGHDYVSAEGNTSNQTDVKTRKPVMIAGWVRIPEGYDFPATPVKTAPGGAVEVKPVVMGSANWERAIAFSLKNEGGFVNHPADKGGPTNFGITQSTYARFKGRPVSTEEVRAMKLSEAKEIYKSRYWKPLNLDKVEHSGVATAMFDMGCLMGVGTCARMVQNMVGVTADGEIGKKSLAAINGITGESFLTAFESAVEEKFQAIVRNNSNQQVFLKGWMNRAKRLLALV